jgi:Uncharacterized alpha/beta hydrolase domain (DUF2235)
MSIEYFVEGKAVIRTGENYVVRSNETIANNAAVSVEQKGAKTGVSYNKPQEIKPNDKPVESINVTLNLFFDGTQNNKTNTQTGKDYKESNHKDDSYTNDFSNVARGFDATDPNAENQIRVYIEGIGTDDLKSDDVFPDVALGTGDLGIVAKVTKGCIEGAKAVGSKFKGIPKEINLTVNVFGFSRGATAARHFIYVATSPAEFFSSGSGFFALTPYNAPSLKNAVYMKEKSPLADTYGFLGACLAGQTLKITSVQFKFAGLYDTVAAYGLNHRGGWGINGDTKQLGLDAIGSGRVHFVLQLAADDEYRDNFDLTNINSAGLYGLELTLPGVHSDIGGSYVDGDKEVSVLFCQKGGIINDVFFNIEEECKKFKDILIEEGWYKDEELVIRPFYQNDLNPDNLWTKDSVSYYGIIGTRVLSNAYDKVALNQMFHYSQDEKTGGVKYINERINKKHSIKGDLLTRIYNQLINYMNACNDLRNQYVEKYIKGENPSVAEYLAEIKKISYLDFLEEQDLKDLRHQYLHWSVKANQLGLGAKSQNNAPKKEGALEAKYRKRHIQNG